jgi:hypothetical protein
MVVLTYPYFSEINRHVINNHLKDDLVVNMGNQKNMRHLALIAEDMTGAITKFSTPMPLL